MTTQIAPLPLLPTPPDDRDCLTARPVLTEADVLLMGAIRDRQRTGFSSDQSPIDAARQRHWWAQYHQRVRAWLFDDHDGHTVAYGALIQRPDGCWVSSCAVLPEFTGHGYGRTLLTWLVMQANHEVYARALCDNTAAVKLHDPLIWQMLGTDETGERVYFRTRPKVRLAPASLLLADYERWGGQ